MQKNIFILIMLCALLFSSCEKTIDFDGEGTAPMIVVNGLVVPGNPIEASVSKSQSLLAGSYYFEFLIDAKVDLYVDGEYVETLIAEQSDEPDNPYYDTGYRKWFFKGETIAENGKTYRLEVTNDGLQAVNCETTVPEPVQLIAVDTATEFIPVDYGTQEMLGVKIKFVDNAENNNFYRVQIDQLNGINKDYYSGKEESSDTVLLSKQQALYLDLFDPVFGSSTNEADEIVTGTPDNRYALFDDGEINGEEYTVKVRLPQNYNTYQPGPSDGDSGNFYERQIILYSLSREYYEYLRSATNHFYYADDYFSEPVPVYTNVHGGMGIFAALDSASYSILSGTYPMEGKVYVDNYNSGGYSYGY